MDAIIVLYREYKSYSKTLEKFAIKRLYIVSILRNRERN